MQISERDADPDPDLPQRVAAALLAQERGDDADDQCRLDALAESDYECGEHLEIHPGYSIPGPWDDLRKPS